MKNAVFAVFASAAIFTSCQSVVDDLNINPNEFTEVPAQLVFNHVVLSTAAIAEAEPLRIAGMWSDQFVGTDRQYITQDRYEVSAATFDGVWGDLFQQGIAQAQIAQEQATAEGLGVIANYSQLLEGYYVAEAALMFGDVPYTQVNNLDFPDPVYEPQEDVLATALALIEASITGAGADNRVSTANEVFTTGETGGTTWGEFGSALLARYYLAQSDYPAALAAARAANFDQLSDGVEIIHTTTNFSENLTYQFEAEQRANYLSYGNDSTVESTLYNILAEGTPMSRADEKTDDAARLAFFSSGVDQGIYRINVGTGGFFASDANFPLVGYPEVQLIIAESAARTGDEEAALVALNNARNYWDEVLGTDSYDDLDGTDLSGDDLIRAILVEKYVSVFGLPTYYDIIRTDNLIGADMDTRTSPAERFLYPSTEISSNSSYPGDKTLDDPTPVFN
ncbi:SusD-like starch-binding protein associating with outer membrane [Neolewinella xylanilytica]|uniref:SusD-like starch-binding protein associating with outer membrane n=1 Tax=Neolewinella xylanilytica TaxID=1514080 RepID=A0A2S6IBH6_9BACT|nr:SusD/RagB family nutrient-binding outer membrane lipoprotein [Neolewinella xylanilytica]PPK88848.1 SusD-like starch-binding protein associating with outer membrane [Neolewinella xylanilytica]